MAASSELDRSQGPDLDQALQWSLRFDLEKAAFLVIIVLAILTRFYDLETRVMSHDESLHTYYSWQLSEGRGFQHTPLMHGPLQFHLVALSYFLFGDSDASARYPVALAGVASIALLYIFRRWLGRWGAIAAAGMMLISPYMLYYQRYVRNESYVVLVVLLMFWAVFRYLESRQDRWIYLLALSLTLHAAAKETSFIYTAQLMLFLGAYQAVQFLRQPWRSGLWKLAFSAGLGTAVLGAGVAAVGLLSRQQGGVVEGTGQPFNPLEGGGALTAVGPDALVRFGMLAAVLGLLIFVLAMIVNFGARLRGEFPAFDLLVLSAGLTLPQLAALPGTLLGWDPMGYQNPEYFGRYTAMLLLLIGLSMLIGALWRWRTWLLAAAIFFIPYLLLFTTFLTNDKGWLSGLVGSLGYWLAQHEVQRGGQPWYYYLLIQVPIYEFLPAAGALLALGYGLTDAWRRGFISSAGRLLPAPFRRWLGAAADRRRGKAHRRAGQPAAQGFGFSVPLFLGFWVLTALVAYSFAGEKMPWLTVHISLPMILLSGWALDRLIAGVDWQQARSGRGWLMALLAVVAIFGFARAFGYMLGPEKPFAGSQMEQLRITSQFLISLLVALATGVPLARMLSLWSWPQVRRLAALGAFALLALLTLRASFRAAYRNYDQATEFLVYAHSATGVKTVMAQIEDLSRRLTDGKGLDIGYDNDVSWPFSWYLRNYPNAHFFAASPTEAIRDYEVIIAGNDNWATVEPLLGRRFVSFEYIRMWWPNQDYFNLTWERVRNALASPEMRRALWQIWLNRDYTLYGELTGKDMSLENWSPSDEMRFYVRKDIAQKIWDYGLVVGTEDPYEGRMIKLDAERVIGGPGAEGGQFNAPRALAFAPDGSVYVADSRNHRIQHLDAQGQFLGQIGRFSDAPQGEGPPGTFNEPWGVAVAGDGSVFVADTWNHRIQRFSPQGELLLSFGVFGAGPGGDVLWGPRAVAVDAKDRLFVADTGNKRIVVYDLEGNMLTQFGGPDSGVAALNEPVGLALGSEGQVYVADTWNQRIQVYQEIEDNVFVPAAEWAVFGWYGDSLENKPYLAVTLAGQVCATDPEGYRVLCFAPNGSFVAGWGEFGGGPGQFGLASGIAVAPDGAIWVSDAGNNRLMIFRPPFAIP